MNLNRCETVILSHVRDCFTATLNVSDLVGVVSLDCSQFVCVVNMDGGDFVRWQILYCRVRIIMEWFVV